MSKEKENAIPDVGLVLANDYAGQGYTVESALRALRTAPQERALYDLLDAQGVLKEVNSRLAAVGRQALAEIAGGDESYFRALWEGIGLDKLVFVPRPYGSGNVAARVSGVDREIEGDELKVEVLKPGIVSPEGELEEAFESGSAKPFF